MMPTGHGRQPQLPSFSNTTNTGPIYSKAQQQQQHPGNSPGVSDMSFSPQPSAYGWQQGQASPNGNGNGGMGENNLRPEYQPYRAQERREVVEMDGGYGPVAQRSPLGTPELSSNNVSTNF
jgi:hypothetical protein